MKSAEHDKMISIAERELATPTKQPPRPAPRNNTNPGALNGDARHPFTQADADRENAKNV